MKDEITKPLLKGDNIMLALSANNGRLRLMANQLEGSSLTLRENERLDVRIVERTVQVTRKPIYAAIEAAEAAPEEETPS